jgi:hypothetical protein
MDGARALLAHGQLLHDLLPETDRILKAVSVVPRKHEQATLRALIVADAAASRTVASHFRLLLYGASLLLVGLLVHLGLRLRARAQALRRSAAFEHTIAAISMRFINTQAHDLDVNIDQALAEMAQCVGADRATSWPRVQVRGNMSGAPRRRAFCQTGRSGRKRLRCGLARPQKESFTSRRSAVCPLGK